MLVLSEYDNKLLISFSGFEKEVVLDSYDEYRIQQLLDESIEMDQDLFYDDQIVVKFENITNLDLLKEFLDKVKNIDITMHVEDNNKFLSFISLFDEDSINNIYVNYQYNSNKANIKEYKYMMLKINEVITAIKELNLSELEIIMVVYDIVKSYKYKEVSIEDPSLSRALHNIIQNDSCVCAGFSNYFNYLLKELNIKSFPIILNYKNRSSRHQRSIIYVNDDKYGVFGIYMFDPTFDCNKDDDYMNKYNYFLQSVSYIDSIFPNEYIDSEVLCNYDVYRMVSLDLECLDDIDLYEYAKINKTVSFMNRLLGKKNNYLSMFDMKCIKQSIKEYKELLNREVEYDRFIELLYNVKGIEQEMGLLGDFNDKDIINIAYKRYKNMYIRLKDIDKLLSFDFKFRAYVSNGLKSNDIKIKEK